MAALRVVMDTNVLVSALLNKDSKPGKILRMVLDSEVFLIINDLIVSEYDEVLSRGKLNIDAEDRERTIVLIRLLGIYFEPMKGTYRLQDEDDRIFFDTAEQARAILITGNSKHFPKRDFILTPAEFLSML